MKQWMREAYMMLIALYVVVEPYNKIILFFAVMNVIVCVYFDTTCWALLTSLGFVILIIGFELVIYFKAGRKK